MEHNVRIGLLTAWGLFILAMLIWWLRRSSSKQYPFSERATVILEAIRTGIDIGIIYWSKSERRFIRRVVTPESLDGYSLRGRDHSTGAVRIFKVTRIRLIKPIPPGAPKRPPSLFATVSPVSVAVIGFGAAGLALLAFVLFRSSGPPPLTDILPPPLPVQSSAVPPAPSKPESNSLHISEQPPATAPVDQPLPVEPSVKLANKEPPADVDSYMLAPVPAKKSENWYLVVEYDKSYKINHVASVLRAVLHYPANEAVEMEQSVKTLGRAVVWSGPKSRAETFRQLLEGYDLVANLEKSVAGPGATNVVAVLTNEPAATTP